MAITVHGTPLSPFSRKVCIALREKQLDFTINPIIPFNLPDDFIKMSPLKKIPVLQDNDYTLADSSAICFYLEKQYSEHSLYPTDPKQCGQSLWFEEYADTAVVGCTTMGIFYHKLIEPAFFDRPINQESIDVALKEQLPVICHYLQERLQSDKKYLVADTLSIADISVASAFQNLIISGYTIDQEPFPLLTDYLAKIWQRESFQAQLAAEKPFVDELTG